MTITELVESKGYKQFMGKIYGWGATVVLLGALFKIQHWPGASIMLIVGIGTEALIFFFSAFEPLHEEIDWTLVYPELAGMGDEMEEEEYDMMDATHTSDRERKGVIGGGGGSAALARFDELLEQGNIGSALFDKLGEGLKKFGDTAQKTK